MQQLEKMKEETGEEEDFPDQTLQQECLTHMMWEHLQEINVSQSGLA